MSDQPCDAAISRGLGCLEKSGNLRNLRKIDRPAVLKFLNENGKLAYATIIALNDRKAMLSIGNQQFAVSLPDLESRWFGDYIVLWRLPPGFNGGIKLGTKGRDVQWLASQLARVNGQ